MTRIIVDDVLRTKLQNLTQPLELCDPSGFIIAHVIPTVDLSEYEPCGPQISDEELRNRAKSKGKRFTTAEVLAHLENL